MDDYNAHTAEFSERYGAATFVSPLEQVKRGGLVVRFCIWPNFGPIIMPVCDVVCLTEGPQAARRIPKVNVLGYVSLDAVIEALGTALSHRGIPFEHLVVEQAASGDAQFRILQRARPKIGPAATDALGEV